MTTLIVAGCKKYKEEFQGPEMGIAPSDFTVSGNTFTASNNTPNFIAQTVYFKANFSASVRWTITLTGQVSGAVKRIHGLSKALDGTTAVWDGSTDTTRLFRKSENVVATLSVLGWTQTLSTTIQIVEVKNHGFVLATFEAISPDASGNFFDNYYWFSGFDTPSEKIFLNKVADPTGPQGDYALKISGRDLNANNYIGKAGLSASSPFTFNFGADSTAILYFNMYVKGGGTNANAKLVIEVFEDDNKDAIQKYDGTEDKYSYSIPLNFDGWKFVSVKYKDFGRESNNGDNKQNPTSLHLIDYYIGPLQGSSDAIEGTFDYPVITVNGPMIP